MDRLTGWDKGNAYMRECFERPSNDGAGCEDMETSKCDVCEAHFEIFRRLAEYEDSGLSPEQVKDLSEKQTLKKVIPNKRNKDIGKCPICKTELCTDDKDLHYCPTCGQALEIGGGEHV